MKDKDIFVTVSVTTFVEEVSIELYTDQLDSIEIILPNRQPNFIYFLFIPQCNYVNCLYSC